MSWWTGYSAFIDFSFFFLWYNIVFMYSNYRLMIATNTHQVSSLSWVFRAFFRWFILTLWRIFFLVSLSFYFFFFSESWFHVSVATKIRCSILLVIIIVPTCLITQFPTNMQMFADLSLFLLNKSHKIKAKSSCNGL